MKKTILKMSATLYTSKKPLLIAETNQKTNTHRLSKRHDSFN